MNPAIATLARQVDGAKAVDPNSVEVAERILASPEKSETAWNTIWARATVRLARERRLLNGRAL